MRRLSYSKAAAVYECAKKGWAMHTRTMPPPMGDQARRILLGHVVDQIVEQAYEERWWESRPSPDYIYGQSILAIDRVQATLMPTPLDRAQREKLHTKLEGIRTLVEQMHEHKLIPTIDLRLQSKLERKHDDHTLLIGTTDVMVDDGIVTVCDVKTGTYRPLLQLGWYLALLEAYGIVPNRIGYWMPLTGQVEWKKQSRLPGIGDVVEVVLDRLNRQDQTPTAGRQCQLCPLASSCNEGIQWLHSSKLVNERLMLDTPGVRSVGFAPPKGAATV
jgi:hypothetical protein